MRIGKQYFIDFISEFNLFGEKYFYSIIVLEVLFIYYINKYYDRLQIVTFDIQNELNIQLLISTIIIIIFFPRTLIFIKNSPRKILFIIPLFLLYVLTALNLECAMKIINFKYSEKNSEFHTEKNVSLYANSGEMRFYLNDINKNLARVDLPINEKYTRSFDKINVDYYVYTGYLGIRWLKKNELKISPSIKGIE